MRRLIFNYKLMKGYKNNSLASFVKAIALSIGRKVYVYPNSKHWIVGRELH